LSSVFHRFAKQQQRQKEFWIKLHVAATTTGSAFGSAVKTDGATDGQVVVQHWPRYGCQVSRLKKKERKKKLEYLITVFHIYIMNCGEAHAFVGNLLLMPIHKRNSLVIWL
jgi:hypothetical protein